MTSWWRVGWQLVRRPRLWWTTARQCRRLVPPGWWRHRPFLPVPGGDYLAFRLATQYGDEAHRPDPADVVTYLEWCHRWDRLSSS